jgi:succinate dehydrogenase/fumarate reductase cytochrome b subunit
MKETKLWTWHLLTGAVILFLLGLHMLIMHMDLVIGLFNPAGGRAIEWENVIARSKQIFFVITYILLLGAALYHGLYGLRTILFELDLKRGMQKFVTVFFWIGGTGLFVTGTYAAIMAKLL